MAGDDRGKLSFSERDRLRRERGQGGSGGGGGPRGGGHAARALEAERSELALKAADALFTEEKGGQAGKEHADAVRAAHGTADLATACQTYLSEVGPPRALDLITIFLDAGDKALSVPVLDELLRQRAEGTVEIEGGLKSQLRILAEDFDDDLASRAEELLE